MKSLRSLYVLLATLVVDLSAESRFPKPDFSQGHVQPVYEFPASPSPWGEWIHVAVLLAFLLLAAVMVHRWRSRRAITWLGVAAVGWFGFYRLGCVCPIGGLQNLAQALVDPSVALPLTTLLIVVLPIVVALFAGRVFCGAVCPFGVLQELVIIKPLRIPAYLQGALRVLPLLVLGTAVIMAAGGAGYPLCTYDPFIGLFRLDGFGTVLLGGFGLLALGTVIARPYCRFLCPYGVVLGWAGRFARHPLTTAPASCVNCHLCADSCPVQALRPPASLLKQEPSSSTRRRVALLLLLAPALLAGGMLVGRFWGGLLAPSHKTVDTARQVLAADAGLQEENDDTRSFRANTKTTGELVAESRAHIASMQTIGMVVGGLVSLVLMARLSRLLRHRRSDAWAPDAGDCVACGRCVEFCPLEHERRARNASAAGCGSCPGRKGC